VWLGRGRGGRTELRLDLKEVTGEELDDLIALSDVVLEDGLSVKEAKVIPLELQVLLLDQLLVRQLVLLRPLHRRLARPLCLLALP
jgi:hypothetical protein